MLNNFKKYLSFTSVAILLLFLQGCTDHAQVEANSVSKNNSILMQSASYKYKLLEKSIKNTAIKGKYESILSVAMEKITKENPDSEAIQAMVKQFKKDSTVEGTLFKSLTEDYNEVKTHKGAAYTGLTEAPKNKIGLMRNHTGELNRIISAMKIDNFDKQFIDYVNILSQISDNIKPVITDKVSKDAAFGSQLVGNANYGEWKKDSGGNSSWSFFEMYGFMSFIDNVFDSGSSRRNYGSYSNYNRNYYHNSGYQKTYSSNYRYDNWKNKRNYSYYNDVYVNKYAKPKAVTSYKRYESNLTKKYKSNIKKTTTSSKQNTYVSRTNKQYSSNLTKGRSSSKTASSSSSRNSGSANVRINNKSAKKSGK